MGNIFNVRRCELAGIRFSLDLFIPEKVFNKIPTDRKQAFKDEVRALKALSVKINEGRDNEEMTVKAGWHKCYHDEVGANKLCEPEQEI